jgi:hypothetical protein
MRGISSKMADYTFRRVTLHAGVTQTGTRLCRIHDMRQHADFLIMPTQYSKPALVATETHLESA